MTPDRALLLFTLLSGLLLLVAAAALFLLREAERRSLQLRLRAVTAGTLPIDGTLADGPGALLTGLLRRIGDKVRRSTKFYSNDDLAALENMIAASGRDPKRILPVLLGTKIVMMLLVPAMAFAVGLLLDLEGRNRTILLVASLPAGLLGPDWVLRLLRRPYLAQLRRGVPDAMDLLVICTEAGMGLESAIERVADQMVHSNKPVAAALTMLLNELRILPSRREALTNFGSRSGVEGFRRMSVMLAQTLEYGTPLGQALRAVATELRRDRMIRLEERAVRLPALLVFPLIALIMPSLFIVLGGVAMMRLLDLFSSMG